MKTFQINKITLEKALETVKPGLSNKEIIEQSTYFIFSNQRVFTYNDEISISYPFDGFGEFQGAVRSKEIYDLLKKFKKEEVSVEITDSEIVFTSGKTKAGILYQSEIKLPSDCLDLEGKKWKKVSDDFIEGMKFCINCCSNDASRPVLTCLHLTSDFIESSDSYRIYQFNIGKNPTLNVLLPKIPAQEVIKTDFTHICVENDWVYFKKDQLWLMSRILTENYPDTSPLFINEGEKITFPKSISEGLERLQVFAKRDIKMDEIISVEIVQKQLTLRAESDFGWIEEKSNIQFKGEDCKFNIDPNFLAQAIQNQTNCIIKEPKIQFETEKYKILMLLKS